MLSISTKYEVFGHRQTDTQTINLVWTLPEQFGDEIINFPSFCSCHIPGARYIDVMVGPHSALFPRSLPPPEVFQQSARAAGIQEDSHVIIYSDSDNCGFFLSARAWWTFLVSPIFFLHLHEIVEGLYFLFSLYVFMCLSVCLSVCLCICVSISEQNSSRADEPIWTRFSLNGCLLYWLGPY